MYLRVARWAQLAPGLGSRKASGPSRARLAPSELPSSKARTNSLASADGSRSVLVEKPSL